MEVEECRVFHDDDIGTRRASRRSHVKEIFSKTVEVALCEGTGRHRGSHSGSVPGEVETMELQRSPKRASFLVVTTSPENLYQT